MPHPPQTIARALPLPLLAATCAAAAQTAELPSAPSPAFVQLGHSARTEAVTAGVLWPWSDRRHVSRGGSWTGFTEVSIGHWRGHGAAADGRAISTPIGLTPLLRYHFDRWPRLFVEGAIGLHVIAPLYRGGTRRLSTAFNFGDHVGIGWRDAAGAPEWTLRWQHFSNGGLRRPNPGEDFIQVRTSAAL